MKRLVFIIALSIICCANIYAHIVVPQEKYTDQQLKEVAVSKGVIPKDADDKYRKSLREQRQTIPLWILMIHEDKIKVLDAMKEMWKQKGVIIRYPSEYYVSEINSALYKSLENGDIDAAVRKGLGKIFKAFALMEGDYDDGSNKVDALRSYIGEEMFEYYKKRYPGKYERLKGTAK